MHNGKWHWASRSMLQRKAEWQDGNGHLPTTWVALDMRQHGRREEWGYWGREDRSFRVGGSLQSSWCSVEGGCLNMAGEGTADFPGVGICHSLLRVQRHLVCWMCLLSRGQAPVDNTAGCAWWKIWP